MFCSTKFELQLVAIWFGGDSDDNRSPIPGRSIVDLVVFPIGHTCYRWLLLKTDSQLHVVSRVHSNMDKLYLTQEFQGFKQLFEQIVKESLMKMEEGKNIVSIFARTLLHVQMLGQGPNISKCDSIIICKYMFEGKIV